MPRQISEMGQPSRLVDAKRVSGPQERTVSHRNYPARTTGETKRRELVRVGQTRDHQPPRSSRKIYHVNSVDSPVVPAGSRRAARRRPGKSSGRVPGERDQTVNSPASEDLAGIPAEGGATGPPGKPPGNDKPSSPADGEEPSEQGPRAKKEKTKKQRKHTLKGFAAGTAVVSLFAGLLGSEAAGGLYAGDTTLFPRLGVEYVLGQDCPGTSPQELNRIRAIVRSPEPPELIQMDKELEQATKAKDSAKEDAILRGYELYAAKQAKKHGLTLVDYKPFTDKIAQAKSVDEVMAQFNAFTSRFGVTTSLEESIQIQDQLYSGVTTIKKKDIELEPLKLGVSEFMQVMYFMPVEVIKASGMRDIKIVGKPYTFEELGQKYSELEANNPLSKRVYIPIQSLYSLDFETFPHETEELLDGNACGFWGSQWDSQVTAYNPPGFQYGRADKAAVGKYFNRLYSESNPIDDKATATQGSFLGLDMETFRSNTPLAQKMTLIFARLDRLVPGYTSYIRSITDK